MNLKVLSILVLIIIISGCSENNIKKVKQQENNNVPEYGGTVVEGVLRDAICLNPVIYKDSASDNIINLVFNGLIKYDKDYNIVGDLAETWEISEDGKMITFHLKKNVKWHDGFPFTARDVKFTLDQILDPKNRSVRRSKFTLIKNAKVIDDYTIMFVYKEVFAPFLESWQIKIVPEHILKDQNLLTSEFNRNPIGTGMFKFKEWITDEMITLVRNPDYFNGAPYIEKYVLKVIPESSVIYLELMFGKVDIFSRMTPIQFKEDKKYNKKTVKINKYHYPKLGYMYLGFNNNNKFFKDIRIRKAITHAINRQAIIDGVLEGYGHITTGPFSISSWGYNSDIVPYAYSISIAKKLLKDAGFLDSDGDGIVDKNGEKLKFEITTDISQRNRVLAAIYIKENLKKIGIEVKINKVSWSSIISNVVSDKKFDSVILAWNLDIDPDVYQIWHSDSIENGYNFLGYKNARIDELLENGRIEIDFNKRKRMYQEIHRIIYNEQPCVFLYQQDELVGINSRIKNVSFGSSGIKRDVNKWYIKQ